MGCVHVFQRAKNVLLCRALVGRDNAKQFKPRRLAQVAFFGLSNRSDGGLPRRYTAPLADIPCSAIQPSVYNLPSPGA